MFNSVLEHLEKIPYFICVVDQGSIQTASLKIGIAQPSLSKSMKTLEEALGVNLLVRSRKGVSPTEKGLLLYQFGLSLVESSSALMSALESEDLNIPFRMGTHEIILSTLWPHLMKIMTIKPKTHVSVTFLLNELKAHQLESIIVPESQIFLKSNEFDSTKIYSDSYGLFCTPRFFKEFKHLMSDKGDLSEIPFVFFEKSIAGDSITVQEKIKRAQLPISSGVDVSSHESAINLALSDVAATIIPKKVAQFYVKKKLLKELDGLQKWIAATGKHGVYLVIPKHTAKTKRMKFLKEQVVKIGQQINSH